MTINIVDIGKRLKNIREFLGMTQKEFADSVNLHQSLLSDMEKGKRNVSFNTILAIAEYNNMININYLINGKGDIIFKNNSNNFELNDYDFSDTDQYILKEKCTTKNVLLNKENVLLNTVQSKNNILVPVAAYGGYLGEWTQEYISQDLVYIRIPGEPHQARTFEVSGDSMEPVICHGDYVVCRRCDQLNNIKIGRIYVIVSALYGISVKYIYHGTGYIVMEPANLTSHQATLLDYADIKEIWEVVLRVTGDIKTTEDEPVRSRIATIEHYLYKQNPKWKGI